MSKIRLNPQPDGYGFLYGVITIGHLTHNINVMPPVAHWDGDMQLEAYAPHDTDWVLYLDGEEVARVRERGDIAREFANVLLEW